MQLAYSTAPADWAVEQWTVWSSLKFISRWCLSKYLISLHGWHPVPPLHHHRDTWRFKSLNIGPRQLKDFVIKSQQLQGEYCRISWGQMFELCNLYNKVMTITKKKKKLYSFMYTCIMCPFFNFRRKFQEKKKTPLLLYTILHFAF